MSTPDTARLIEGLREQTDAFVNTVEGLDPGRTVPSCPEWRVRDLVGHIGQADRWAAAIVRTRAPAPVPDPRDADPGEPGNWADWLVGGAAELANAIRDGGADTEVWTFLGPRPAVFWLRRMVHDTSVHLADAALTAGTTVTIAPDLAAAAITEALELMAAPGAETLKPALAALRGHGETLQLRPDPPTIEPWLITRTPNGVTWRRGTGAGEVTAAGTLQDLLLLFARRLPADSRRVDITGDRVLLDHWLANTAL